MDNRSLLSCALACRGLLFSARPILFEAVIVSEVDKNHNMRAFHRYLQRNAPSFARHVKRLHPEGSLHDYLKLSAADLDGVLVGIPALHSLQLNRVTFVSRSRGRITNFSAPSNPFLELHLRRVNFYPDDPPNEGQIMCGCDQFAELLSRFSRLHTLKLDDIRLTKAFPPVEADVTDAHTCRPHRRTERFAPSTLTRVVSTRAGVLSHALALVVLKTVPHDEDGLEVVLDEPIGVCNSFCAAVGRNLKCLHLHYCVWSSGHLQENYDLSLCSRLSDLHLETTLYDLHPESQHIAQLATLLRTASRAPPGIITIVVKLKYNYMPGGRSKINFLRRGSDLPASDWELADSTLVVLSKLETFTVAFRDTQAKGGPSEGFTEEREVVEGCLPLLRRRGCLELDKGR
ncbi:hypothetical protein EIP91_009406 [Steccherinum ochraceum]|uniref:F-box domain-containing protein n=1 Tax=Steccherinum ochraceum TaxID=92696 RepID=A0A4R0R1N1_9APHY|nr:hypothetical protein EIP91_009406 [Steccherinum ochraceum]